MSYSEGRWTNDPYEDEAICLECGTLLTADDVVIQVQTNGVFDGLHCAVCFLEINIPAPTGVPALTR